MRKYKLGLVIGRFQPFHLGHKYLLGKALALCDKIVIGIGSSNRYDDDNPIAFKKREKMLKEFLHREDLEKRVEKIFPIADVPNDDEWFKETLKKSGPVEVVIGNNDWVKGIFEDYKYQVLTIPYYKREILEGQKIRQNIRTGKKWQERVPAYLRKYIELQFEKK